jgi:hypothetical protein
MKGAGHMQTTNQPAATTHGRHIPAEPLTMRKRIGSTLYLVNIHFSESEAETMNDKILRLIRNEAQNGGRQDYEN